MRSDPKLGSLVDLPVHKKHHAEGQVEGPKSGEDSVGRLPADLALFTVL